MEDYREELFSTEDNGSNHQYYWFWNCDFSTPLKPEHGNNVFYFIPSHSDVLSAEVLTTAMAILSIIGCALIMFSYIAYRDIRTRARTMLFHLSVADLVINISLLFGLYVNFVRTTDKVRHTYNKSENVHKADFIFNSTSDPACYIQAAVTTYATVASLLWSNVIGIFMVVLVVCKSKSLQINRVLYVVACFVCWLVPLVIVVVDGFRRLFGYVIITSTGCYIFSTPKDHVTKYRWAEVYSYDIWLVLTLILLPVLYTILFYYTHCKVKHKTLLSWKGSPDVKLLLVPIIFLLTRIWSELFKCIIYYAGLNGNNLRHCHVIMEVMTVVDGIGANSQGAVNAVLFCFFTRSVRRRLWKTCMKMYYRLSFCCCGKKKYQDIHSPTENDSLYWPTASYEALNN